MKRVSLAVVCLLFAFSTFAQHTSSPNGQLDLDGLPDLKLSDNLGQQWVVRDENLGANFCSVIEGGVTPGLRRLLRFTVTINNIGDADVFIGDPNNPAYTNLFELSTCHGHYHFKNYARYELVDPASGYVWRAAKVGFCMLDTDPVPRADGSEPPRAKQFLSCGAVGIPGYQGISHGWADTYRFFLGGQYFVLDGGDGQPPVPPGDYIIRITANPAYAPDKKGNCPLAKDAKTGLCHNFPESDFTNNVGQALITIPSHPGRDGVGPLKNEKALGYEPADHQ
ncbi:MAG TPA: lysyl oxidase family protein [Thermoanaerobaculia bacterium]|nr:lysyl oxidase family protein [Thermoanaerobaculia bacterium]